MKLKASYTVEATIVISVCFILFAMAVCLSYEIFKIVLEYVKYKGGTFDAAKIFRLVEGGKGFLNAISK